MMFFTTKAPRHKESDEKELMVFSLLGVFVSWW